MHKHSYYKKIMYNSQWKYWNYHNQEQNPKMQWVYKNEIGGLLLEE